MKDGWPPEAHDEHQLHSCRIPSVRSTYPTRPHACCLPPVPKPRLWISLLSLDPRPPCARVRAIFFVIVQEPGAADTDVGFNPQDQAEAYA